MSYIILSKYSPDNQAHVYRIAKNQNDLNYLNIIQSDYNIVEISEEDFDAIRTYAKYPITYENGIISYDNLLPIHFTDKEIIQNYIETYKNNIKIFLDGNQTHPYFNMWNDYYNQLHDLKEQLNNLEFNELNFPSNKSLTQYFDDLGKVSLNILQLP
jgi:hypothetical protein